MSKKQQESTEEDGDDRLKKQVITITSIFIIPLLAFGYVAAMIVLGAFLAMIASIRATLSKYAWLVENVYISSQDENDKDVLVRASKAAKLLKMSGNQLGLFIRIIVYRDQSNPNETWEAYEERRDKFIEFDRVDHRETMVKERGIEWVLNHMSGQNKEASFKEFHEVKII